VYREHFGLVTSPFGISPRLDFLYKSGAFAESMAHLVYGLENNEAIVMITGAIGTGKTMAIQSFLTHLGDQFVTALVTNTTVDAKGLLKLVLDDLDRPSPRDADKSDLLIAFKQLIIDSGRVGKRVVIVIDEAQNLSREVLEDLRLLTNLGQGELQPVQIVLVGQSELDAMVSRPDLAQLRQRIRVHYKLTTLTRQELGEYVDHRMAVAGGRVGVFTGGALDRIFDQSGGIPRVVNTLCGDALLSAYVAGHTRVESADVELQPDSAEAAVPTVFPEIGPRDAAVDSATTPRSMAGRRGPSTTVGAGDAAVAGTKRPVSHAEPRNGRAHGSRPIRAGKMARRWALAFALVLVAGVAFVLVLMGRGETPWGWRQSTERAPVAQRLPAMGTDKPIDEDVSIPGPAVATSDSLTSLPATAPVPDRKTAVADDNPAASAEKAASAAPERSEAAVPESAAPADESWFIHVSSFRTAKQAAIVAADFGAQGVEAVSREHVVAGSSWYRVYLGPYGGREAAERRAEELRSKGDVTYFKVERFETATAP
jgi:type II secretory pathway predicted ATPase ExeA/cell division septation protein DedD